MYRAKSVPAETARPMRARGWRGWNAHGLEAISAFWVSELLLIVEICAKLLNIDYVE